MKATDLQEQVFDFVRANGPASKRTVRAAIRARASAVDDALRALEGRGLLRYSSSGWEAADTPGHASIRERLLAMGSPPHRIREEVAYVERFRRDQQTGAWGR
jgi:hypothetical protein